MHPNVHSSIIYNNQDMEASVQKLINGYRRWVHTHTHIHTHKMEYYSSIRNEILPFATWIDLESILLDEIRQKEKDKYYMILLIYGI